MELSLSYSLAVCRIGKLHERLVPEDDEEVSYEPGVVMQHVRAVMKTAVAEHSAIAK